MVIAVGPWVTETPAPGGGKVGRAAKAGADEIDLRSERIAAFFDLCFQLEVGIQAVAAAAALPVSLVVFGAGGGPAVRV